MLNNLGRSVLISQIFNRKESSLWYDVIKKHSPFPKTSSLRRLSWSSAPAMKPLTPAYLHLKTQHMLHINTQWWNKHNSQERGSRWEGAAILSWVHTFWSQWANPARLFRLLFRRTRTPRIWACPHLRGGGLSRQQERWRGCDGGWSEYVFITKSV